MNGRTFVDMLAWAWLMFLAIFAGTWLAITMLRTDTRTETCVVVPAGFDWPAAADYHDGGWWIDGRLVAVAPTEDSEACMTDGTAP